MLFMGCLGVGFGIGIASWLMGAWIVLTAIVSIGTLMFFVRTLSMRDRVKILVIFILGLAIGVGRYAIVGPGANSIANDVGNAAIIEGRIVSADLQGDGVMYVIDQVSVVGSRASGERDDRIRLEAPISSSASIGSYLRASCVLEQPQAFDGFAYDRFLAAKSIYAICRTSSAPLVIERESISASDRFWIAIGSIHAWIDDRARAILPEPQATLFLGLLIGENSFSDSWTEKFQTTGTSHIVAASGYNVAIVAELALMLLVTIGFYRKQAYPIVVACIAAFVVIAGAGGAVIRAGIMGILVLTARHIGRHASPRNILALTVVAMLLFEPRLLRDDVGFQLSVCATIGLIFLSDRIGVLLKRVPTTFGVRESLASTIAATIATLPITMMAFGKISIVAPMVNMLVLPFVPYAMAFGGGAIAISSIVKSVGVWLALPVWTALATMTSVIDLASRIPFASANIGSGIAVLLAVLALAMIGVLIRRLPKAFERDLDALTMKNVFTIVGVLAVLFVIQISAIAYRSGRWNDAEARVFVFDVGQGDAMLIDGADRDVIIDGGPTRFGLLEALSLVRFPWERSVDVVIATHPHADHIIGLLALIETYEIGEIMENGSAYSEAAAEAFREVRDSRRSAVGVRGQRWELGLHSTLQILWPLDETADVAASNVHERAVVAKLTVGEKSMLFTGDAEAEVEASLGDIGEIDVLKVGHHGSDTSSSDEFLRLITPSIAVISLGEGNPYGHPSPFVLGRLSAVGSRVLRTDRDGTIRIDFWQNSFKTTAD
jgi:competence protein ComEC